MLEFYFQFIFRHRILVLICISSFFCHGILVKILVFLFTYLIIFIPFKCLFKLVGLWPIINLEHPRLKISWMFMNCSWTVHDHIFMNSSWMNMNVKWDRFMNLLFMNTRTLISSWTINLWTGKIICSCTVPFYVHVHFMNFVHVNLRNISSWNHKQVLQLRGLTSWTAWRLCSWIISFHVLELSHFMFMNYLSISHEHEINFMPCTHWTLT